ncbi:ATP-binding protein [Stenotrophomonas oahuensis]|uniref:AAA family ATPase n=1 Tax=Stenotrophomonas oahuensis TaxID=3003271 RepID=A0ABY9YV11_9GAMM|nr:AAA family ATPase [Stenotrophomonas sp. A5586]WNH54008.1 AAA family ATPase [Stenotrophomonas sp. A5586]
MAKRSPPTADAPVAELQRPPAELLYADELARLRTADTQARPPGWALSLRAARAFILGDAALGTTAKVVAPVASIERMLVTLATGRGLMLVGEPGTAKSLLSELLAAAISGVSTLTIQGGASTTEDQIKYGWNYALLINEGPSPRAMVPAPLYQGMRDGRIVRFEEITRAPQEVQDCLLGMLSDRVMAVPELEGEHAMLYARDGFNIIATANTRDRGVNEMSAALKRRFDFETVAPILDFDHELALVQQASARLLERSGIPASVPVPVLELLVNTFRDLRGGGQAAQGSDKAMDRLNAVMSTAEAVNVAHAVGVRAWFLEQREGSPADLVECIAGTVVKDNADDRAKLRRYFEHTVARREGPAWRAYFEARHRLP